MENEKVKTTRTRKPKLVTPETGAFNWGKRDFGIIAKSFESEPAEVQNTMIAISGMLQVIKLNLNEQPVVTAYLLKKAYPELSEVVVLGNLKTGLQGVCNVTYGETLPELLTNLATFAIIFTDVQHNTFWDGMFKAIAAPLTQWEKICAYAPYVYNVLVKSVVK